MDSEYYFNKNFITILIEILKYFNLFSNFVLNNETKYTIKDIIDVVVGISEKKNNGFKLPIKLTQYLNISNYSIYSKDKIKQLIKRQIINTNYDNFLKTYIVIGHNYPVLIKELNVVI